MSTKYYDLTGVTVNKGFITHADRQDDQIDFEICDTVVVVDCNDDNCISNWASRNSLTEMAEAVATPIIDQYIIDSSTLLE